MQTHKIIYSPTKNTIHRQKTQNYVDLDKF